MSDTEERKSMDDVLASIRRIVRAEKDPEAAQEVPEVAVAEPADVVDASVATAESAPLALTPDMRVEEEPSEDAAEALQPLPEAHQSSMPDVAAVPSMAIDPETLRDMVREVVLEQLASADGDQLVRKIIREELVTGDVGANISKNVVRLIRTEVDNALSKQS